MIELSSCVIILLENNGKSGIPSVFRTILETFVELANLAHCKTYGYCMEVAHNRQWLNILQSAQRGNPFLKAIADEIDLDEKITEYQEKISNLRKKGFRQLKVYERFELAGMENEHESLYNFLSCDAHSNIRALIRRHAEFSDDDFQVVYYRDEPTESFLTYIDSTIRLLINSATILHNELESEKVKALQELLEEYDSLTIKA